MRTPSRFMPKLPEARMSALYWVVLAVVLVAMLYLLWRYPLAVGALLLATVFVTWIETRRTRRKLSRLAAERAGEDIGSFAKAADYRSLDTWVVRAVYEQLQTYLASEFRSFPIRWTDNLESDLRIDAGDLEDIICSEIAERSGRDFKFTESNPHYGKIQTAGDLVLFFNAQPHAKKL